MWENDYSYSAIGLQTINVHSKADEIASQI